MGVCNAVYFQLYIDLMHITPSVSAKGCDGTRGMPNEVQVHMIQPRDRSPEVCRMGPD